MNSSEFLLALFFLFNSLRALKSDLTISGAQCGQIKCKTGEFCSEFDFICKPCATICTQSHNFDENTCIKKCQDYLHDMKYVLKDGSAGGSGINLEKLKGDVQRLSQIVSATLIVVCFMLIVLIAVLSFQLYRWKIKKNITLKNLKSKLFKKSEAANDVRMEDPSNKNLDKSNAKPDLRLDISNISTVSDHSPVTAMTSVSTRRPAEDNTLDYAYDNHAMSSSPK